MTRFDFANPRCNGSGEIEWGTAQDSFGNWDTETYKCPGCPNCDPSNECIASYEAVMEHDDTACPLCWRPAESHARQSYGCHPEGK